MVWSPWATPDYRRSREPGSNLPARQFPPARTALTPMPPPWEVNGERYVDGGTVTPLPLRVAIERGATEIYALHIDSAKESTADSLPRGVVGVLARSVDTMLKLQADYDLHLARTNPAIKLHYVHLYI